MQVDPLVEQLVMLRVSAELTQTEVATRMGTSQPVVARLEAGERDPRLSTLRRYGKAIGVEPCLRSTQDDEDWATAAVLARRVRLRIRDKGSATTTFREVVQFLDDARRSDPVAIAALVCEEPMTTGQARWDAVVAAAVEWLCAQRGVAAPRWSRGESRRLRAPGWFVTPHRRLHELVRESTPPEFAGHGVYVDAASLESV